MAHQLLAAGQEIASLILMETVAPSASFKNTAYWANRLKIFFRLPPARLKAYLQAKVRHSLHVARDDGMRFKAAGHDIGQEERRWLEKLETVYSRNLAALEYYRSRYYPGKVTLFNAIEKDPGILPDPNYGWIGLAREIEIHEVPGNHNTMLAEPHVTSLATAIRQVLRNNESRDRRT
jgi:thioesterase domain-containing protein